MEIGTHRFKKVWAWPSDIEDFLKLKSKGFIIHVCNGNSVFGNLTIDRYTQADIKGDMYYLPIKTGVADTVICDPPWGIPRHLRAKLVYELRRILKIGGILIFNAPWLPRAPGLKLLEIWLAESVRPMNDCGIFIIYEKTQESMFDDR